jgi:hypothetical protein
MAGRAQPSRHRRAHLAESHEPYRSTHAVLATYRVG